jgi:hypothetical protein
MEQNLRLEWMDPDNLDPNPRNWRVHPERQKQILHAVLAEVGWAGVALYNERTGHLIDGHARRDWAITQGVPMPVLVGSWSDGDELKLLATLDPIAAMADQLDVTYRDLLLAIETDNSDLRDWCTRLVEDIASTMDGSLGDIPELGSDVDDVVRLEQCPKCGFEWKRS